MDMAAQMHPVDRNLTLGQRTADAVTAAIGSWPFIIIQSLLLTLWIAANVTWMFHVRWDPYPFILLNLTLSFQAAYTGPVVMMSSNRQASRDRALAKHDHELHLECLQMLEEIIQIGHGDPV